RDVQIRGHRIRLPLDVMLVATANPEDYTNRGRIITPLKDRFGAQIRTHYPRELSTELAVIRQEERAVEAPGVTVAIPPYMSEVVASISQLARQSPHINQRSGVSVRLSVSNHETLAASAVRRALRLGEPVAVPRVSDLAALASSTSGKVEVETLDEGGDQPVVDRLVRQAVLAVFRSRVPTETLRAAVAAFDEGTAVQTGDAVPAAQYVESLSSLPALREPAVALAGEDSPAAVAAAMEFLLEGLHLSKRLNKESSGVGSVYRSR
ncbi:MAG: magnesium chelatase, partial [Acidimicrobiales bacterium]